MASLSCWVALFITMFSAMASVALAQQNQAPIWISLRDTLQGRIAVDSANWSEGWIEEVGAEARSGLLVPDDLIVTDGRDTAEILSVDTVASRFRSRLSLSFVLDNSQSMFHSYDSLTTYLDTLVRGLPVGVMLNAIVFDNQARFATSRYTTREGVYLSMSGVSDSIAALQRFWHYYDTVRTRFTPLYDAMELAAEQVLPDERVHVFVVITDGEDNGSIVTPEQLTTLLRGEHIRLFLVSYRELRLRLRWLARQTGGAFYHASDLEDLRAVLDALGRHLTRSYYLRFRFPSQSPIAPPH